MNKDTIFALASGSGRAAVAVIRISGPQASGAGKALAGRELFPRYAHYVRLRDPNTNETLDRGLALYFPAPRSATGEDCAELHVHGGRAVIDAILTALSSLPGLRLAEPGEFSRRALIAGKMDLSQVEGLADLIDANTEFQRRQALRVAGGAMRELAGAWRTRLSEALALIASDLDFADEDDVDEQSHVSIARIVSPLIAEWKLVLNEAPASDRLRDGFQVLIMGPPNAGKSTLLNRLAQRDAAIVSEEAGTTRDLIEVQLDLEGLPITLVDSAGLREANSQIENLGVIRARERVREADLVLWLSPGGLEEPTEFDLPQCEVLKVASKSDSYIVPAHFLGLSTLSNESVDRLKREIIGRAIRAMGDGSTALIIRDRHRKAIEEAVDLVQSALQSTSLELVAEDLQLASRSLSRLIGSIDTEELLDLVFSRFCIGK